MWQQSETYPDPAVEVLDPRFLKYRITNAAVERLEAGDFYILCPDNAVTRQLDERRILWAAGDIVENRPPLSRWHPDYAEAFAAFVKQA